MLTTQSGSATENDYNLPDQRLDLNDISISTFPLPTLWPRLRSISKGVHLGRGLAIITGLDPDRYSLKENIILFAGLSSYIGDKRGSQGPELDVLSSYFNIEHSKRL